MSDRQIGLWDTSDLKNLDMISVDTSAYVWRISKVTEEADHLQWCPDAILRGRQRDSVLGRKRVSQSRLSTEDKYGH
jgi:hypothetical protein